MFRLLESLQFPCDSFPDEYGGLLLPNKGFWTDSFNAIRFGPGGSFLHLLVEFKHAQLNLYLSSVMARNSGPVMLIVLVWRQMWIGRTGRG